MVGQDGGSYARLKGHTVLTCAALWVAGEKPSLRSPIILPRKTQDRYTPTPRRGQVTPSSDSRGVQKRRKSTECSRKPCPLSSQKRHLGTPEDEDLNGDHCETWELFPCSKLPTHHAGKPQLPTAWRHSTLRKDTLGLRCGSVCRAFA